MSGGTGSLYSVDTSSFMDWQARYYPTDLFTSLLGKFDALLADGRLLSPKLVEGEIEDVGTPDMVSWAAARPALFVPTGDLLAEALSIKGRFPGLLDPKATKEEADAYVIALAKLRTGGIVVTQETAAAEKRNPKRTHFIPDVCRELGIPCISILGMMRKEGWTF